MKLEVVGNDLVEVETGEVMFKGIPTAPSAQKRLIKTYEKLLKKQADNPNFLIYPKDFDDIKELRDFTIDAKDLADMLCISHNWLYQNVVKHVKRVYLNTITKRFVFDINKDNPAEKLAEYCSNVYYSRKDLHRFAVENFSFERKTIAFDIREFLSKQTLNSIHEYIKTYATAESDDYYNLKTAEKSIRNKIQTLILNDTKLHNEIAKKSFVRRCFD